MRTYAYRTETLDLRSLAGGAALAVLNALGAQGWELVSSIPLGGPEGPEAAVFVMRRAEEVDARERALAALRRAARPHEPSAT